MTGLQHLHDSRLDFLQAESHGFVTEQLGLSVFPIENIAFVSPEQGAALRGRHGPDYGSGYSPKGNRAIVIPSTHPAGPRTVRVLSGSQAVHEITLGQL